MYYVFKYCLTALVIVGVSEAAKHNDQLGAILAALPIVTVLTLLWLQVESQPYEIIRDHVMYTLYYVVPSLPMFFTFPFFYDRASFWMALSLSILVSMVSFVLFALAVYPFGIHLV